MGKAINGASPIYELAHLQELAHSNLAGVGWGGVGWIWDELGDLGCLVRLAHEHRGALLGCLHGADQ